MNFRRHHHKSDSNASNGRKQVLILGAGMVCAPVVEYLYRDERLCINVCSQFKDEADRIANKFPGVQSTYLNVTENPNHLADLCRKSDVVLSLLPYGNFFFPNISKYSLNVLFMRFLLMFRSTWNRC